MSLTKEQARSPKRKTEPLQIEEFDSPMLLAKPSGLLSVRLQESKVEFSSEAGLTMLVADMAVDECGAPLYAPEDVPAFLASISTTSLTALIQKCLEMYASTGGGSGNSKPSTSGA